MLLHQSTYPSNLLQKYGMQNCRTVSKPQVTGSTLFANKGDPFDERKYPDLIGCLTYAVKATRPDKQVLEGTADRVISNASGERWQSVKRILRYIKATLELGIQFDRSKEDEVRLS